MFVRSLYQFNSHLRRKVFWAMASFSINSYVAFYSENLFTIIRPTKFNFKRKISTTKKPIVRRNLSAHAGYMSQFLSTYLHAINKKSLLNRFIAHSCTAEHRRIEVQYVDLRYPKPISSR